MDDLHRLTTLLKEIDDQLVTCMRCGMCQSVCPLFAQTLNEADVARGKLALLDGLASELIRDADGVQEKLNRCLLCGSCQANCPSGVRVLDIFLRARTILVEYQGLSTAKKLILRGMLTRPELFNSLVEFGTRFQGLFTSKADPLLGTSCSALMSPMIGDRHFLPLAKEPFHKTAAPRDDAAGRSGLKVAFYYGCLVDKMFPHLGDTVLRVLDHHQVSVFMPENQACCGIPAIASGDRKTFARLLELNLEVFGNRSFDVLVTPCATCTSTIRKIWPLFAEDLPADKRALAHALSARVMDINEFLVDRLNVRAPERNGSGGQTVTWHDPCHLKKSLGVAAQPRELIRCNGDCNLVEMNECDTCCGCGGSFNLYHYDESSRIGGRKRDNIVSSGADVVATGCPACMMQLTDMLSQNSDRVRVKHAIEVYAESLGQ
ncbi:(Fe-S)-binding protein [Desulfonema ishimotonii]|uniref:Glycolate oxidase iron-sulfur subunit n=1 Tax=Desulfonema ishimotonii TaxID=45657 RepID=A0A401FT42_9BACT|nr:(Fe-S)-binding protein [Desulfonema ishimotonii]GBC60126.1 (Fe-S)-binding protein [Desulfonema ishimotonii]